jgi:hypothetical protein
MPERNLILYGCGSDVIVDFVEVCEKNGVGIKSIIRNVEGGAPRGLLVVPSSGYDFANERTPFLVPLFTPRNRYRASREALGHGLAPFDLLSDRNTDLPARFVHGRGCFINKGAVVGSHTSLGDYVFVNRGACLGHHVSLEDFVSIGPGVVTGGGVTVRRGALLGTGAVILPGVRVGEHAVVGGGAVVTRDVDAGSVVVGNPARHVKDNESAF